jgi:hypothetical protein
MNLMSQLLTTGLYKVKKIITGLLILISTNLVAQTVMEADTNAVKSIDGIVNKILKIVSGEEGKNRDWETYRILFLPNAQLTVLYHSGRSQT